jgi:hypothetical protein
MFVGLVQETNHRLESGSEAPVACLAQMFRPVISVAPFKFVCIAINKMIFSN